LVDAEYGGHGVAYGSQNIVAAEQGEVAHESERHGANFGGVYLNDPAQQAIYQSWRWGSRDYGTSLRKPRHWIRLTHEALSELGAVEGDTDCDGRLPAGRAFVTRGGGSSEKRARPRQ